MHAVPVAPLRCVWREEAHPSKDLPLWHFTSPMRCSFFDPSAQFTEAKHKMPQGLSRYTVPTESSGARGHWLLCLVFASAHGDRPASFVPVHRRTALPSLWFSTEKSGPTFVFLQLTRYLFPEGSPPSLPHPQAENLTQGHVLAITELNPPFQKDL